MSAPVLSCSRGCVLAVNNCCLYYHFSPVFLIPSALLREQSLSHLWAVRWSSLSLSHNQSRNISLHYDGDLAGWAYPRCRRNEGGASAPQVQSDMPHSAKEKSGKLAERLNSATRCHFCISIRGTWKVSCNLARTIINSYCKRKGTNQFQQVRGNRVSLSLSL